MSEPTVWCSHCLAQMRPCPWGGLDCPRCDKGHHAGPDWQPPFEPAVRELPTAGKRP